MTKKLTILLLSTILTINPLPCIPQSSAILHAKTVKVFIAPENGVKFHCSRDCRGLKNANRIEKISKKAAREQGYTKCKICY